LQNLTIENNKLKATLVWPFDLVPPAIKQMISNSIQNAIKPYELDFEYNERIMNENERQNFLKLEQENWKGF
jgi:hypothetical protein